MLSDPGFCFHPSPCINLTGQVSAQTCSVAWGSLNRALILFPPPQRLSPHQAMCLSFLSLRTLTTVGVGCLSLLSILSPCPSPLPAESSLPLLNRGRGDFICVPGQMALPGLASSPPASWVPKCMTVSPVSVQVICCQGGHITVPVVCALPEGG